MARPSTESAPENSMVNIAGDFTDGGLDIEPNEPGIERDQLRPNGGGGIQFEDQVPLSQRGRPTGESFPRGDKAREAGKQILTASVDFPVDE